MFAWFKILNVPSAGEATALVGGGGARWEEGQVVEKEGVKWTSKTRVRLLRGNIVRWV